MEITSTSSIYVWLVEGIFLYWLAALIIAKKQYKVPLGKMMLLFFGLGGTGTLMWSVSSLLTENSDILKVFSIAGDVLFLTGLSFSWVIAWYLFFRPRGMNILYCVIPVVAYLTAMSIFTFNVTSANPPRFVNGEFVYYVDQYWSLMYTFAYLPLPFLGVYFLQQASKTKDSIKKFRAVSWGVIHIAIGIIGLTSYFLNFTTRNTLNIVALSFFAIATVLYQLLIRFSKKK